MKSIAQTVKNREKGHESSYVRQHAFHMLARCGSDADSAMVLEMTASSKDLQTRRTGLYARIVNDAHPQAAEQFIYELEHEPDLAAVTLDFDLVHYGNKALYGPVDNKSLENVIVHNLRHIQSHQRAATAQIALRKLLDILFKYGARQFDRRRIYPPIKRIVEQFGSTHYSRLTNVEKKFLNHFHLLKPAFNPSETERVAGPDQLTFTFS